MRPDILLIVDDHFSILNCSALPLIGLFQCSLQSICLRDAGIHPTRMIAKDVVNFPLFDALENSGLHNFVRVTLLQKDLIFMLVLWVKRNQSEVVLVGQMSIKFEHMLHGFIFVNHAVKLWINDEDDALFQNVMMAQVLIDWFALVPANFRQEWSVHTSSSLLLFLDLSLLRND